MKKSLMAAICIIMLLFLVGCNNNNDTSLKCMNCGESIADDAKFCPQCGETILDTSDGNNNGSNVRIVGTQPLVRHLKLVLYAEKRKVMH